MKKIKAIAIVFMLCLIMSYGTVCNGSEDVSTLFLYSTSAVLMDADSGRVLYGKNEDDIMPMASTTKIMTLIITLENANLDDIVSVSSYAAGMPEVRLGMKTGETYRLIDLLYSLMLESHNDSAVAIAEHVSGNVGDFASLMNEKARSIGANSTYYITPNGLDATDENGNIHSTTATDLALIMSYCIKSSPQSEKFIEITQTRNYSFADVSGKRSFSCSNKNSFLDMMDGVISGKTGYTSSAGYCYVGALENDGRTYVVALLACGWPNNKTYKWSDAKTLINYGMSNYTYTGFGDIEVPQNVFDDVVVTQAVTKDMGGCIYVAPKVMELEGAQGILASANDEIEITINRINSITAPISEKQLIGYVSYSIDGNELARRNIIVEHTIFRIDFKWCIIQVLRHWFIKK